MIVDKEIALPMTCKDCKHYIEGAKCKAFDAIPIEIFFDAANEHKGRIHGQKGAFVYDGKIDKMNVYVNGDDKGDTD